MLLPLVVHTKAPQSGTTGWYERSLHCMQITCQQLFIREGFHFIRSTKGQSYSRALMSTVFCIKGEVVPRVRAPERNLAFWSRRDGSLLRRRADAHTRANPRSRARGVRAQLQRACDGSHCQAAPTATLKPATIVALRLALMCATRIAFSASIVPRTYAHAPCRRRRHLRPAHHPPPPPSPPPPEPPQPPSPPWYETASVACPAGMENADRGIRYYANGTDTQPNIHTPQRLELVVPRRAHAKVVASSGVEARRGGDTHSTGRRCRMNYASLCGSTPMAQES